MTADPKPIPSATILLVRDGAEGLEAFMVKRHHQIDFASGALVFPGGKTAPGDADPRLRELARGAQGLDAAQLTLRAAAIREAFEESGLLLARPKGGASFVAGAALERLTPERETLNSGALGLADLLAREGLELALDALVPFAHWITPSFMPKRFDTHFYIAAAPAAQTGRHDGTESVDSVWIRPQDAVSRPEQWTVIFPTRMNLLKLGRSATVAEALAAAHATPVVTVEPRVEQRADGPILRLPVEAGYGDVAEPLSSLKG